MLKLSLEKELEIIAKNRGIRVYKSMSEGDLKASNPVKTTKTVREIRKENRGEYKILRDLGFMSDPKKNYYDPKKLLVFLLITTFNMKVWEIKTKIYQSKNILMLPDHI